MSLHKSNTAWMSWWAPPSYLHHCNCDLAEPYHVVQRKLPTYIMWYGRCHLVSIGPGYVWLAEPYHVVPLESSAPLKHGIGLNVASFFYTIQTPICSVGCLMITNRWTDISLYFKNTAILENKKQFVFFGINLWILVTFTFKPCKLHKMVAQYQ